jgi:hypothetical protein
MIHNFAQTAQEEAEKINSQVGPDELGMSLVVDQEFWEKQGISTGEELALSLLSQTFSDTYKTLKGFRPRGQKFSTVEQAQDAIDGLEQEYEEMLNQEEIDLQTQTAFEEKEKELQALMPGEYDYESSPKISGMGQRTEGTKRMKKISLLELQNIIKEEISGKKNNLASFIFEQDTEQEEKEPAESEKGGIGDVPKGSAVSKSTNVKDVDPREIVNQLLSGEDDAPVVAATQGNWFATSGAEAKAWVEKIGPEVVAQRISALASKIPATGLPKNIMPFLPGPDDAQGDFSDVKDALSPGGKLNVDMMEESAIKRGLQYLLEKQAPPSANQFTGMDPELKKGAAAEFMTAGLNDGNPDDDKVTVTKGGSLAAADAIPTQSNILIYKALGMAMNPKNQISGGPLDAWAGTGGEILDGHHRWAATMLNDPSASMGLAGQVDLSATGDKKEMLMYLTAIGNALGNATKTESANKKDNLLIERWRKLAGILND